MDFNTFEEYKSLGGILGREDFENFVEKVKDYTPQNWSTFYRGIGLKAALIKGGFNPYVVEWNIPNEIVTAVTTLLNKLYSDNGFSYYREALKLKSKTGILDYFSREDLASIVDEAFALTANENNMFNSDWLKFQYDVWRKL